MFNNFFIVHIENIKLKGKFDNYIYVDLLNIPENIEVIDGIYDFNILTPSISRKDNIFVRCFPKKISIYITDSNLNFDGSYLKVPGYLSIIIPARPLKR